MTIIADLDLGAAALPLSPPDGGDATDPLRILGLVPAHDGVTLYLCLESTDPETLQDLSEGQAVEDVESVATDADSDYRVVAVTIPTSSSWFLAALDSPEISLLQGVGTDGGWFFQLRFADREALAALVRRCTARDVPVSVVRRYRPVDRTESPRYGLTPAQRETLRVAKQAGYFEVPRETTTAELGELLGVSDTAASQRLRRGLAALVADALTAEHPD